MNLKKAIIPLAVILVSYSIGRYSSPAKVEIKEVERVVYKENESKDRNLNSNEHYIETVRPDGTIIKERIKIKEYQTRTDRSSESERESSKEKLIENRPDWSFGLVYEPIVPGFQEERYTGIIERRILGEIYLGLAGSSEGTFGLSFSIGF
jgi:hypothetical protein